jgi:anti-sigma-K factor RskA
VAVGAAGAGAIALNRDDDVVVASTSLDPLESADVSGTASVVEEDGVRVLRIELDAPAAEDAFYEAWLADESSSGMIAMGSVRPGTTTTLPVPDGIDLADWPTVEISVEPVDGDPGHSGVSLVRGALA